MHKMKEADLTAACVRYSGQYVEEKFKGGSLVERNLVVNSLAHGYFMGRRHAERTTNSWWRRLLFVYWMRILGTIEPWLEHHARSAGNYYLKKLGYTKLEWAEQALIRATVSTGFRAGFGSGD